MNDNEFYTFEDRAYIQPTVSSGEQEAFINNLRDVQARNNADIAQQTHNLGTDISSNLGGLGGGETYFNSRYQTPQVNEMVDALKAASQAEVVQDIMQNYQAQLKEGYNQAARKYQKRQRAYQNASLNSGSPTAQNPTKGGTKKTATDQKKFTAESPISIGVNKSDLDKYGTLTTSADDLNAKEFTTRDKNGNIVYTNRAGFKKGSDGFYHPDSWFTEQSRKKAVSSNPVSSLVKAAAIATKIISGR